MKKLKKFNFLEGAFIATFCIIVSKILGIIYVIPFYNIIGEKGGTLYGYAYNIYNILLIISSAGIPFAISKITSEYHTLGMEDKKNRMYTIANKIINIFSIVSFLICFIFANELARIIIGDLEGGNTIHDVSLVIRLISFALLIVPRLSVKRGYLQGHTYIKEPSISQIIEQIVRIIIIILGSYFCVYIFKLPVKYAVGISVFAAFLGALIAYIYLDLKINHNKKEIGLDKVSKLSKKEDKEIIKKIITCSIPFIVINLANTIYTFIDMVLVIRTLPKLGFSAFDTEFISSVFTTWGIKFNTIVSSVSTGLIISLIPHMVKSYTEKDNAKVNQDFNKCLKIILFIITPLAIFISSMSNSMWNFFYRYNEYGPRIIKITILVTVLDCIYMVTNSIMQSIDKRKMVYVSVSLGLFLNLVFDIILMNLFYKLNIPAYYGAICATLIGFLISDTISLLFLNKEMKLNYKETIKTIPRFILSIIILVLSLKLCKSFLPISSNSKIIQLGNLLVAGLISGSIYLFTNFDNVISVMPEKILNKFKKNK